MSDELVLRARELLICYFPYSNTYEPEDFLAVLKESAFRTCGLD